MVASQFNKGGSYRYDIDGLRAIAVLAVIINHMDESILPSGYLGVDMFFVISGFVITASIMRSEHSSLGDFLLHFYQRRIKRLIPALAFFVVVTAIALMLVDEFPRRSLLTGAASMLGFSNLELAFKSTDYFSPSVELNAFLHTWSLGVEEQFYFVFPLMFWLAFVRFQSGRGKVTFYVLVAFLSAISLACFIFLYDRYPSYVYFFMPTRFWELGAGVLVCGIVTSPKEKFARLRRFPPIVVVGLLIALLFSPVEFAAQNTFAVVVTTALLIATVNDRTFVYSVLTVRPMMFLGLISYSLYLWHWGVLVVARLTIDVTASTAVILIAIMLAIASFSYLVIEKPLRHRQWAASAGVEIILGVTVSFICIGALMIVNEVFPRVNLAQMFDYDVENITDPWWEDRATGDYLEVCHAEGAYTPELLDLCIPERGSHPRYFLIGDSHARNYLPTIRGAFDDHVVSYLTMGHDCAYLPENLAQRARGVGCTSYVEGVTQRILESVRPGDVVFIGQRIWQKPERWTPGYFQFLFARARLFSERGARVVLLDGTYPPPQDPRFCLDLPWRPQRDGCFMPRHTVESDFSEFDNRAHELANANESLFYAPLRTGLCNDDMCGPYTKSGSAIWHDAGHITERAAGELSPVLKQRLAEQGFFE